MDKKEIRAMVRKELASIPQTEFEQACEQIAERLFQTEEWERAYSIAITIANEREVHTKHIIEKAWKEGKKVAVPKCRPSDRSMVFRMITDFNQLESVYCGLLEPKTDATEAAGDFDMMIVPGVAFDLDGYRIGYGGGYYDRYLQGFEGPTISLLLAEQLISAIPRDEYDIPVNILILPNGVYRIDGRK